METLLVCTVGSSHGPVVATLKHWRPVRVRFVCTPQSKPTVEQDILPIARAEGCAIDAGRYDILELADGQDFAICLDGLRDLTPEVERWASRGEDFGVVADFTGATKSMSAALAIQAARWPRCVFSYVGGKERTKDGIGEVVAGTERILHHDNPWEALALQAVDEFTVLFDEGAFTAAKRVAEDAMSRVVKRQDRKRALAALAKLAQAFDAWERFDHGHAARKLHEVQGMENDLRAALGAARWNRVRFELECAKRHVTDLANSTPPTRAHVTDLLANADRRRREGRLDDAAARLSRAVEALAQVALCDHGFKTTSRVAIERVPDELRERWRPRSEAGVLKLGLQDAYELLASLGDRLGARFRELSLDAETSSLRARNASILAHGFDRVSDPVVGTLWKAALDLAGCRERDLPTFPRLSHTIDDRRSLRGG